MKIMNKTDDGKEFCASILNLVAEAVEDDDLSRIFRSGAKRVEETPPGEDYVDGMLRGLRTEVRDRALNDIRRQSARRRRPE